MNAETLDRAQFTAMTEGTQADWQVIAGHFMPFAASGGARVSST